MAEQLDKLETKIDTLHAEVVDLIHSNKETTTAIRDLTYAIRDGDRRGQGNGLSFGEKLQSLTLVFTVMFFVWTGLDTKIQGLSERLGIHWSQPMHAGAIKELGDLRADIAALQESDKKKGEFVKELVAAHAIRIDTMQKDLNQVRSWMYRPQKNPWPEN